MEKSLSWRSGWKYSNKGKIPVDNVLEQLWDDEIQSQFKVEGYVCIVIKMKGKKDSLR